MSFGSKLKKHLVIFELWLKTQKYPRDFIVLAQNFKKALWFSSLGSKLKKTRNCWSFSFPEKTLRQSLSQKTLNLTLTPVELVPQSPKIISLDRFGYKFWNRQNGTAPRPQSIWFKKQGGGIGIRPYIYIYIYIYYIQSGNSCE